ncbi:hypothetical protein HPG69_003966 [Diceros bicornis minor]|uniref:Vomeronasal type-1 receptor n=1 Tax=Diceros bicornis minor TaxID=77932 RepID=A0A7J7EEF7_DICBM|nr:hypothetical protein HPG69_003966 [Diceros bicornis minor]
MPQTLHGDSVIHTADDMIKALLWAEQVQEPCLYNCHSEALSTPFQKDVLRTTGEAAVKTTFLLQIGAGTVANVILFFHNVSSVLLGHRQRPTHDSHPHGHGQSRFFFPLEFPTRSAHSTTLCSTCVLSTYQFTLIPQSGMDNAQRKSSQGKRFCSPSSSTAQIVIFWSISDATFIGLTGWASGSMALLLHRHHQRVQYTHTLKGYHKCPPEIRATHTNLMLVVTFVIPYLLNSIFTPYMTAFLDTHLQVM